MDVNYGAYADTVKSIFYFAADPTDGGEFSNMTPTRSVQNLTPQELTVRNGRTWPTPPTIAKEGLTLAAHPVGDADFNNPEWIDKVYIPSCIELVKKELGAKQALQIFPALQRRVDYDKYEHTAPNAAFIHLDFTRESAIEQATYFAASQGVTFKRACIVNVWKVMTPPPQDFPLAVADRHSIPAADHVPGKTVEYLGEKEERLESPYVLLTPSDRPIFYYYPDMTPDETLVFVGLDLDPANPLGCAHTAFKHPSPNGPTEPRGSIEARFIAIFE